MTTSHFPPPEKGLAPFASFSVKLARKPSLNVFLVRPRARYARTRDEGDERNMMATVTMPTKALALF